MVSQGWRNSFIGATQWGTLIQQPVELTAPPTSLAFPPPSSLPSLSLPLFLLWSECWPTFRHGERRWGSQARLICRGGGKKAPAPFIVACVCVCVVCVWHVSVYTVCISLHIIDGQCVCVMFACCWQRFIYLFIYFWQTAVREKQKEKRREQRQAASSGFSVYTVHACVCVWM